MAERRSMGAALTLTPEKLAFIAGEEDPTSKQLPSVPARIPESIVSVPQGDTERTPTGSLRKRPKDSKTVNRDNSTETDSLLGTILVPLTTRLHQATAEALRRACLEQRLRCRRPATQQDIVESAVRAWMESHGYLKSNEN